MKLKSLRLSLFIIGTIIGAGFASGKEIATFFTRFGFLGVALSVLCGYLFYLTSKLFLNAGQAIKTENFSDVSKHLFKKRGIYFDLFLCLCFSISSGAMVAGSNALGVIIFENYSGYLISVVTCIISMLITFGGLKALNKTSYVLVPIMLILITATCIISFVYIKPTGDIYFKPLLLADYFMGIGSTILFISLNMLMSGFLLMQVGPKYNQKEIRRTSLILSILLAIVIALVSLALIFSNFSIFESEMPIIALALNINKNLAILVVIVVWLAIITCIIR